MDNKMYGKFWIETLFKNNFASYKVKSVHSINYEDYFQKGYRLIIFDYDDTLTDFHGNLSEQTKDLLKFLNTGYKIGILSNFPPSREKAMLRNFEGIDVYFSKDSNKPNPSGYEEIMNHFKISREKTLMVGDKVGTDLFGAYLAGISKRILVEPYSKIFGGKKPNIIIRIFRRLEIVFD